MSDKNIKDYLHLYWGASCFANIPGLKTKEIFIIDAILISRKGLEYFTNIQPILRPLSDITKDEAEERAWGSAHGFSNYCKYSSPQGEPPRFYADDFQWLLSKHFDLFGLIEAGLAIDKTKIG